MILIILVTITSLIDDSYTLYALISLEVYLKFKNKYKYAVFILIQSVLLKFLHALIGLLCSPLFLNRVRLSF